MIYQRIRVASAYVALCCFAFTCNQLAAASAGKPPQDGAGLSRVESRFAQVRNSPPELYAFLLRMPKGGDLHNHLSGAVYAESFVRDAVEGAMCVDLKTMSIVAATVTGGTHCGTGQVDAAEAEKNTELESKVIDSLSMRDFVPGAESAHDHFFAAFDKFAPVSHEREGQFIAEVVNRAADQNESYLELMALGAGGAISHLGSQTGLGDFEQTRQKLLAAGIEKDVAALRTRVDTMEQDRIHLLSCESNPNSPPCRVAVRYIFQVLRNSPKEQVFAQVLAGFMLASSDPRVAAVNFVQPEDGATSMRDYHLHMQMVDYMKRLFPQVHITLHAGELAPGLVPPEGLRFHIREAVELGHAERIGHGVDIMYETNATDILRAMAKKQIDVEINLTSNDVILGVAGKNHPFPVYRKYGVPVTLSTDDEGVSRTHLTEEYQRAVETYGLTYADLKQIVRNSLEYSFLPGASYWTDSSYKRPASGCAHGIEAASCSAFLQQSEKAKAQADLERRFAEFEASR